MVREGLLSCLSHDPKEMCERIMEIPGGCILCRGTSPSGWHVPAMWKLSACHMKAADMGSAMRVHDMFIFTVNDLERDGRIFCQVL